MSSFLLKVIACITMFIDHLGYVVFDGHASYFNYIGRIAFPIFAYQLSVGYTKTSSKVNYAGRLLAFAIISQIPFYLFVGTISTKPGLNIFFTLFLGFSAILIYDKTNKILGILCAASFALLGEILHVDYGAYGVILVFVFYLCKNSKILLSLAFMSVVTTQYMVHRFIPYGFTQRSINLFIFNLLPLIPILLYNQKQGRKLKYFLYIFYPVHLLILYFLIFII